VGRAVALPASVRARRRDVVSGAPAAGALLDDRRVELRGQRLLARAERRGGAGGGRGTASGATTRSVEAHSASMRAATATSPDRTTFRIRSPQNPV